MGYIHRLSDQVINHIRAGEVIQRPASVLKELVENSIDAGASKIDVVFRDAGKSMLSVQDDGDGMTEEDATLCIERHTTSKLYKTEEISQIKSLGFRGEALSAISSISDFTLKTRQFDRDDGTQIDRKFGMEPSKKGCICEKGTLIRVQSLFSCVPARLKFLKSDRTERSHLIETMYAYAWAYPHVGFSMKEENRTVLSVYPEKSFLDRGTAILGNIENFIPLEMECQEFQLEGLITKPVYAPAIRYAHLFLVNGRPVQSRVLSQVIKTVYTGHLSDWQQPRVILSLKIPPEQLDTNVHPEKKEVRFRQEYSLRKRLVEGLGKELDLFSSRSENISIISEKPPTYQWKDEALKDCIELIERTQTQAKGGGASALTQPETTQPAPALPQANAEPAAQLLHQQEAGCSIPQFSNQGPRLAREDGDPFMDKLSFTANAISHACEANRVSQSTAEVRNRIDMDWRFNSRIKPHYALFSGKEGFLFLNLKAAYQRVYFESICDEIKSDGSGGQRLLIPKTIHLSPTQSDQLIQKQTFLSQCGIEIEPFGDNTVRITSTPAWLSDKKGTDFFHECVNAILDERLGHSDERLWIETMALRAQAHHFNRLDWQSEYAIKDLLKTLLSGNRALSSPKGQPTFFTLSHADLKRRFKD